MSKFGGAFRFRASRLDYLPTREHLGGEVGRIGEDVEAHFFHLEARSDWEDCGSVVTRPSAVKAGMRSGGFSSLRNTG
jgi:hypothetical protein